MMRNKRYNIIFILISIIFVVSFIITNQKLIHKYDYNNSKVISNIISLVKDKYPNVSENEIIDILNDSIVRDDNTLLKYGIDIKNDSIALSNKNIITEIILVNILIIVLYILVLFIYNFIVDKIYKKRINKLIDYLTEISHKNYTMHMCSNKEGELSILQNEIYKIMVMLKESADNSLKDKIQLKDSLSDISHQLKTPLTSINIALDNIINDPNMDNDVRTNFYYSIQREINNVNTLVLNLLKLSKFDADIIKFNNEYVSIKKIIDLSIKKVELIADLKNIKFNIDVDKNIKLCCDKIWQVEAISNIIKNAIEYSYENGNIDITATDDNLYYKIVISDHGCGIDQNDLPNIFNRFYKTKSNNKDSVGIGLSLAKAIIEKNNGVIKVKSIKGKGTSFIIKYYK